MSQCNLFAFHTMFNLLYSFQRRKERRGQSAGCGSSRHHVDTVRVCCSGPPCFAANPRPAHAEVDTAVSSGCRMHFVQGGLWQEAGLHAWSTWGGGGRDVVEA